MADTDRNGTGINPQSQGTQEQGQSRRASGVDLQARREHRSETRRNQTYKAFLGNLSVIGSMIMGAAGSLYVAFYAYIGPQDLAPILTFQAWAMLIVGGAGNNRGAVLGAFLVWAAWTASVFALAAFAPQAMQLYTGPIQYILIGSVIVGMLLWRPQGILPEQIRQQGRT